MSAETTIEVHGAGTSRTFRAIWALHELGLPYRFFRFGPRTGVNLTPEFTALNPKQKIPTLKCGDFVLTESGAILTWLNHQRGPGVESLVPDNPEDRARYDEWMCFTLMELDAHTLYVLRKHGDLAYLYGEAPAAMEAARAGYYKQSAVAEQHLKAHGPWLLGDTFSGADILMTTCTDWAVAYDLEVTEALLAHAERAHQRPAYGAARATNYKFEEGSVLEVTP